MSARIIDRYFGPIWTRVSGPVTYSFRPKLRLHAPTISITLRAGKKRGPAKRLTAA